MHPYELAPHLEKVVKQTGYETIDSLMFLHLLVKYTGPGFIIELGTGYGCSAIFMALGLEFGKIISADDYRGDTTNDINVALQNITDCGVADKIELKNCDTRSDFAGKRFFAQSVDLVFMDASHNKSDMWSEYEAFVHTLKNEHIIVVDDTDNESVTDFINELALKYADDCHIKSYFHNGMSIFFSNKKFLEPIKKALGRCFQF